MQTESRRGPAGRLGHRAGAEGAHFLVGSSRYVSVGAGCVMPHSVGTLCWLLGNSFPCAGILSFLSCSEMKSKML